MRFSVTKSVLFVTASKERLTQGDVGEGPEPQIHPSAHPYRPQVDGSWAGFPLGSSAHHPRRQGKLISPSPLLSNVCHQVEAGWGHSAVLGITPALPEVRASNRLAAQHPASKDRHPSRPPDDTPCLQHHLLAQL